MLRQQGWPDADLRAFVVSLQTDFESMKLSDRERSMLEYAAKLTRTPADITSVDVAKLRAAGFDDRAIHDICAITSYYAFVNRIADGLGVEIEPHVE